MIQLLLGQPPQTTSPTKHVFRSYVVFDEIHSMNNASQMHHGSDLDGRGTWNKLEIKG